MKVLAGDIGGTNARLAVVEVVAGAPPTILHSSQYPSRDFDGLAPIVREFRRAVDAHVESAAFGLAGPVVGDECRTPNLPWRIDRRALAEEVGIPRTALLNDFRALGYGIPWLRPTEVLTLQEGEPMAAGPIAILGAGTGLGEGFLLWGGTGYEVHSSEGGHADLAARDELQWGLVRYLRAEFGNASYERILSGPGLVNAYRFLAQSGYAPEQPAVREEMQRHDPAAVVSRHGLAGDDELCSRALEMFVSVYGAQAGNLALTVLATGGVFLAGGIAPRIVDRLRGGTFLDAFRQKGRLTPFLSTVPVYVVTSGDVAVIGAAVAASRLAPESDIS